MVCLSYVITTLNQQTCSKFGQDLKCWLKWQIYAMRLDVIVGVVGVWHELCMRTNNRPPYTFTEATAATASIDEWIHIGWMLGCVFAFVPSKTHEILEWRKKRKILCMAISRRRLIKRCACTYIFCTPKSRARPLLAWILSHCWI